ncbi:MAG: PD-(D/E)XK nuclease family protein [Clostridium sp.]|nr:PD-(D/E)XK nuclease family protein [Clostridium sp.]
MARNIIYQSGAWHDFPGEINCAESAVVVIPEYEDKRHVAKAVTCIKTDSIFTIPELIARFIHNNGGRLVSPHTVESMLTSIIAESFIPYLKIENNRQSYIRALAEFICNFRNSSLVDLDDAMADFRGGNLSVKEKDLIKIYSEYVRRLPDYGFDTKSALFEFLRQTGTDNIHRHLGIQQNKAIIFFGFNYLTPLEEEFIYTVCKHLPGTSFFYCFDTEAAEQSMRIEERTAALLERLKPLGMAQKSLPPTQQDFFTSLSRKLFKDGSAASGQTATCAPTDAPQGQVSISRANSRFQEIVSVARQIRQLAKDDGVSISEIRVVAPAYDLYSSIIGEVFPDYGLPFSLEQGVPLLRFPLAALILHLANQGASSNPYPLREKILSSPYIAFSDKISAKALAAYQETCGVELLSREKLDLCIKPGSYRLDYHYTRNLRQEAYRTVKPAPGALPLEVVRRYQDSFLQTANTAEKQLSHCLIQFYLLARAEKALTAWQARMSGSEFAETLRNMLQRFQVAENIIFSEVDTGPRDQVILTMIHQLLDDMVSSLAATAKSPADKLALTELARIFSRLLDKASLRREEYEAGGNTGVSVQPVGLGQYQKWRYTFICGLVDGEFPATEEFNFLQPKKEGLGLGQPYTSVDHGRSHFYHLTRATGNALFLSHPLSDNGRRLPPSPFVLEMAGLLPNKLQDTENAAINPCPNKLYSQREKLLFISKNVDYDYESVRPLLRELKNEDPAFFVNIVEILRFDGLTLSTARFSEFDGLFDHQQTLTTASSALPTLADAISKITFTPIILERYAACPLRFFLDDILGLKQRPDYDADTTDTGRLIRSLLRKYTAQSCADKGVPAAAPLLFRKAVAEHLQQQDQAGTDAFHARFINGLTAGLDSQEARPRGLLAAFLEYEKSGPDCLTPYLAALTGTVTIGGLDIWVEADRLDLAGETGNLLAYTYTCATTGEPGRIRRGLRFDLPLTVLLAMNYTAENQLNLSVAGAGLYQVKTAKAIRRSGYFATSEIRASRQLYTSPQLPVFSGQREGFMTQEKFLQALENCRQHILRLCWLMCQGVFHLPLCLSAEQTCDNCSFGRLCRKDQLRLEKIRRNVACEESSREKLNFVREIFD